MVQEKLWRWKRTRNESRTEHGVWSRCPQIFRGSERSLSSERLRYVVRAHSQRRKLQKPHPLETSKLCQPVGRDRGCALIPPLSQDRQATTQSVIWMFFCRRQVTAEDKNAKVRIVPITFHTAIPHEGDSRSPWR